MAPQGGWNHNSIELKKTMTGSTDSYPVDIQAYTATSHGMKHCVAHPTKQQSQKNLQSLLRCLPAILFFLGNCHKTSYPVDGVGGNRGEK